MKRWLTPLALSLCVLPTVSQAGDIENMISPVTNPVQFEDPRHSSELRPIFIAHEIQDDFVTGGGSVEIYALQARFKVTDNFSIIATKDGIVNLQPKSVVGDDTGLANIALGGKYTFLQGLEYIVTGGLRYEIPLGDEDVLQGEGDGALNPFVTTGLSIGGFNVMAATGLRTRFDSADSSYWDLDLHVDYPIGDFYPLIEFNMVQVINDGERLPIADEGADFFNLGASKAAGNTLLTMGVGARYRIMEELDAGLAYQFPLDRGEGSGIFDWRITADLIWRFEI